MTHDALRAAIASARLRPRMYAQTTPHLASMLYGMIAGAAGDGVDIGPAWGDAYSPANVHAPTDAEVCDAAEATVAALWPQGDAPAGDECAAFSAAPLDTPMPPAFVEALASLSPAQPGALDLDAIEARANAASAGPWVLRLGPHAIPEVHGPKYGVAFTFYGEGEGENDHADADAAFIAAARTDVPALVARVRELEADIAARDRSAAETRAWLDEALGVDDHVEGPDTEVAALRRTNADLRARLRPQEPAPLDFHGALAAVRSGRFVPAPRCPQCDGLRRIDDARGDTVPCPLCVPRSCGGCSATWPLDRRDCPGCGYPDRDAGAVPDTDLCPKCGALDLDHACPKSAATVAGEAFATEHPYAAAGIMGSATAREGKG